MKIKRESANKFSASDEHGIRHGVCVIRKRDLSRIFPDRPVQYEIIMNCDEKSRYLLWSAATTRALVLASAEKAPSRVFASLKPDEGELKELLTVLGFCFRDGIVRYEKAVTSERVYDPIPEGCTIVRDYLTREDELTRCLNRYNECFGKSEKRDWLEALRDKPDFARVLMVSRSELCGEALLWTSGRTGVVGILQTSRKWRRQGVASYLLEDARKYFNSLGISEMSIDVWLSSPGCVPLAEKKGFIPGKPLLAYPYIDIR